MDLEIGSTFAEDYRIEKRLASGGMGSVYVATQISTGRRRALKLMHPDLARDAGMRRRFEQEARVGATIESEHVVEVIGAGVDTKTSMPWLAMELLDGEDLARRVARRGALPAVEVRGFAAQIAHALAAAHAVGVVHRDLKPENVFVARAHREGAGADLKLLDFGIAKVIAEARTAVTAPVGTLLWMAPEQAESHVAIGPAADVWAFGFLVFFMLTGQTFWPLESSPAALVKRLVIEPLPAASARAADAGVKLPEGFDAWFARCAAREPAERFASVSEARAELERVLAPAGDAALAATMPQIAIAPATAAARVTAPRRRPGFAGLAIVAIGALAAGALAVGGLRRTSSTLATTTAAASVAPPSGSGRAEPCDDCDGARYRVELGTSPRRGGKTPLLTIVEFADFQCPFSAGFEETLRKVRETYGDDVAVVWKHAPFDAHPNAGAASRFAELVRRELGDEAFWKAHDALFRSCSHLTRETFEAIAREVGLDPKKVGPAVDAADPPEIAADLEQFLRATEGKIPVCLINGATFEGGAEFETVRPVLERELATARALEAKGLPRAAIFDALTKDAPTQRPPPQRVSYAPPSRLPCLTGRDAGLDPVTVHELGDYASGYPFMIEPVVKRMLAQYGPRIRFCWITLADPANEGSMNAAAAAEVAFHQMKNDGFWRLHAVLVQNGPRYFEPDAPKPRGFSRDAVFDYARQANVDSGSYFGDEFVSAKVRAEIVQPREALLRATGSADQGLLIDGRAGGGLLYLAVQRELDRALGERGR